MKVEKQTQNQIAGYIINVAIFFSALICVALFTLLQNNRDVTDGALSVFFFGLTLALFGCRLIIDARDPITTVNKISVLVLWMMGCIMMALFLTFILIDPLTREYVFSSIGGLQGLLTAITGIVLYRHELQQKDKHLFDDPLAKINALKDDAVSLVPIRMGLLLAALLIVIVIFNVWVAITVAFPQ